MPELIVNISVPLGLIALVGSAIFWFARRVTRWDQAAADVHEMKKDMAELKRFMATYEPLLRKALRLDLPKD